MTNNHAPDPPKRHGYNPITLDEVQANSPDPFFANLDSTGARIVGAALFLFVFAMSRNPAVAAPLILLVLLACLLFRMNTRERTISAVPLTFAAVRLGSQLAGPLGVWHQSMPMAVAPLARQFDSATTWLPLFLAAYLFFTSTLESHTGRVVFWYALGVLLSGLLPGEGYVVIFAMLFYSLFFAILVAIIMDFGSQPSPSRPLSLESQPVRV